MASCKDCIHSGVCKMECKPAPLSDIYTFECECIEKYCGDFKDRSRFVELPCHTGEKVLVTYLGRGEATRIKEKGEVIGFHITASLHVYTSVILENGSTFTGAYGKNVLPRKEEAEQALKERE